MSVVDANLTLLSFRDNRKTLASSLISKIKTLDTENVKLLSIIDSGSDTPSLQVQQNIVTALQSDISSLRSSLKQLYISKRAASNLIISSSPTPVLTVKPIPTTDIYDGPRGPTGPTGSTQHVDTDLVLNEGSSNAASSGAVYTALQSVASGDVVSTVNSLPNNPVNGEVVYDDTTQTLYIYINNGWKTTALI